MKKIFYFGRPVNILTMYLHMIKKRYVNVVFQYMALLTKNCYFFKVIEIIGAVLDLCTVTSLKWDWSLSLIFSVPQEYCPKFKMLDIFRLQ